MSIWATAAAPRTQQPLAALGQAGARQEGVGRDLSEGTPAPALKNSDHTL